jgi:hypothetical protein
LSVLPSGGLPQTVALTALRDTLGPAAVTAAQGVGVGSERSAKRQPLDPGRTRPVIRGLPLRNAALDGGFVQEYDGDCGLVLLVHGVLVYREYATAMAVMP